MAWPGAAVAMVFAGQRSRAGASLCVIKFREDTMRKLAIATLLAFAQVVPAAAQSWPDRPVKFIVHVAAGGGVDFNARILVEKLNQQLPHPVLIENMGGAGGTIA